MRRDNTSVRPANSTGLAANPLIGRLQMLLGSSLMILTVQGSRIPFASRPRRDRLPWTYRLPRGPDQLRQHLTLLDQRLYLLGRTRRRVAGDGRRRFAGC